MDDGEFVFDGLAPGRRYHVAAFGQMSEEGSVRNVASGATDVVVKVGQATVLMVRLARPPDLSEDDVDVQVKDGERVLETRTVSTGRDSILFPGLTSGRRTVEAQPRSSRVRTSIPVEVRAGVTTRVVLPLK
jgi:hypothetical protein